jgi:hypothetical protein
MEIRTIGIDVGKTIFHLVGMDAANDRVWVHTLEHAPHADTNAAPIPDLPRRPP